MNHIRKWFRMFLGLDKEQEELSIMEKMYGKSVYRHMMGVPTNETKVQVEKSDEGIVSLLSAIVVSLGTWFWLMPHVFTYFWTWFIVPLGVVQIGHWHALGILTMINLTTFHIAKLDGQKTNLSQFAKACAIATGVCFAWLIGYLCS